MVAADGRSVRSQDMLEAPIALTFDDGPDRVWTPRILAALGAARARATFFVLGARVRAAPELIAAILEQGHAVELHGHAHLRHPRSARAAVQRDTELALAALDAVGVRPGRWRLPWGEPAPWSEELADRLGLELTGWTVDTHDWRGDPAADMLRAAGPGLRAGAVVLMHDALGPGARRDGCEETVRLIAALARRAKARGSRLGALPESTVASAA